jgi:murein L,D-transpeptidase YcbB/YkuD
MLTRAAEAIGGAAFVFALGASSVSAQAPGLSGAEWRDAFDVGAASAGHSLAATPIMSPETIYATELAIQNYSAILANGGWPVVPDQYVLRLGDRHANIVALRQRLIASGDLGAGAGISDIFDTYVEAAVKAFQVRHGIPADGIVGENTLNALNVPASDRLSQLQRNLTRLRELAAAPADRFVMVNIPGAEIEVVQMGRVVSRHTAIVGKVDRPSPIINSRIYEVNFNPFWTVPASIIRRDLIPLMQSDPDYLNRMRIRAYNGQGVEVPPQNINWNSDEATRYMFRQDPGDFNSLGSVRINFYNPYSVYMHDTPLKTLFGNDYRFDSSGCVRVQNVRDLITWLLRDTPGWSRERVDEMFRNGERLDVQLAQPVNVYFSYVSAWATADGVVHFRNDIYGQDGIGQVASAN